VGVSEATAAPIEYARLGQRSLAFLIDVLVWGFFTLMVLGSFPEETADEDPLLIGVVLLVLLSAGFNYFWLAEWKWGRTIGKAVVRIRIRGADGTDPELGPTTVRNFLRIVDAIGIGPILIARSERHQRLGDLAAKTVVLSDRGEPERDFAPPVAEPAPPPPAPIAPGEPPEALEPPEPEGPSNVPSRWKKAVGIPAGRWSPIHILYACFLVIGFLIVESVIIAAFDPELEGRGSMLALQAMVAFTLIGVAVWFAARKSSLGIGLRDLGLRGFAGSALGITALAFVGYIVLAAIYGAIVEPKQDDITRDLGLDEGGFAAFAGGFLVVVAAPLSEEIFFRGFMYGGLRRRLAPWAAALISGLVFGMLHFTGGGTITVVPPLLLLGVLLALLYERTGSLWPPIILHAVNNGIALIALSST
jgi:membrane protease YdiL (CAAX protease family)/uncharacterized RDD family membrane protein YckC